LKLRFSISSPTFFIELTKEQEFVLHSTIKKVGEDIENLSFNTAISQMMIFVNEFTKAKEKPRSAIEKFVLCLAPFAPHIAEEMWQKLGYSESVMLQNFPDHDEEKTKQQEIEFVVQVKSKIRARINIAPDLSQEEVENIAKENEAVQKHLEGKEIKKVIFVPNKLINFIAI
jgi:leucyl-tRNA synthetase